MSPVVVTFRRTVSQARNAYVTAFEVAGFLAVVAAMFAFGLESAEGGPLPLAVVWAAGVAPVLPVFAAVLAMGAWSDERQSGRLDMLLSVGVRVRSLVLGKFLGVWAVLCLSLLLGLVVTFAALAAIAPQALRHSGLCAFVPGLVALALQGALWTAVSTMMSAMTRHSAVAACASIALTAALPRGLWAALMSWAPLGRTAVGEMPFDAHVVDMASGIVTTAPLASYALLVFLALFISSKAVTFSRLQGRGARALRFSTVVAIVLSVVWTVLAVALAMRLDAKVDLQLGGGASQFSPRMRDTLAEAGDGIAVTCFLSRSDSRFRSIGIFLRALKRESDAVGGRRLDVRFVDPHWDLGAAERLTRLGVHEESLVFEKSRRIVALPLKDGYDERICVSAIRRIAMPPQRRCVYWTVGHGEKSFDAYGALGMSDIARDLAREGYRNDRIDLSADAQIPADCALILVVGAREDFSRVELGKLDAYLKQGGRLLALLTGEEGGVSSLLSSWGVRSAAQPWVGARTLSGSDVIVSDFSDHVIASPLKGTQIILERPLSVAPSAAAENGTGADRLEYTSIANVGTSSVAAAVERGAGAGADLAIRPTRIVAVGDASFVMNGQLASRANANRDFFLNCVAYLSGTDAMSASGVAAGVLTSGMDRRERMRFLLTSAVGVPTLALALLLAVTACRRRRG